MGRILCLVRAFHHRRRVAGLTLRSKGRNVQISPGFIFHRSENIAIGDHVYIGPDAWVNAMGGVVIRGGTIIGPRITIYTANHRFRDAEAIPYDDVVLCHPVEIGENTWIGGNVIIVPGVTIGEGCVVGAGSVVTKDVPSYSVVGGNPAKVIGTRDVTHYLRLKSEGSIYLALKEAGRMHPHAEADIV